MRFAKCTIRREEWEREGDEELKEDGMRDEGTVGGERRGGGGGGGRKQCGI